MPSIARTVGLIFVIAVPVSLTAQTTRPNNRPPGRPVASPGGGYTLPGEPSGGLPADWASGTAPQGLQAGPLPNGNGTAWMRLQGASQVVSAGYAESLSSGDRPAASAPPAQPPAEKAAGVQLSLRGRQPPIPLPPPDRSTGKQRSTSGLPSVVTVASSLALVLGIFFLVAWGMRRTSPPGGTVLPDEVFEILGRAPMASRQQVHLLRCGNKLILVSVTAAGAETLAEITDPAEVDRLAGLCRQAHPNSATAAFRQVFGQFVSLRPQTGLFAAEAREDLRPVGAGVPVVAEGLENRNV